jgi:RNA polymerase sigma factor (sigma-70 family)
MNTNEFTAQVDQLDLFLHNFATRLTSDSDRAKDLVQDTILRAFRYKHKFQDNTNFKGWIATIMRNTFINNYRKEKRNRTVSEPVETFAYALQSNVIAPNAGESNLRVQEIHDMLDRVGDLYSIPFLLHYQGYEYQEISTHLNIPIGTTKSRIFTARKKMKVLLQE